MSNNNKYKILLVEDDSNLSMVLQDYLELLGYEIKLCNDGEQGLKAFKNDQYDLCILDIMMPKKDGFSLAEDIRSENQIIPIIFLTAKALKEDKIKGFKTGCDDYITKPFSTEELSLRIEAILKRCNLNYSSRSNNLNNDNYVIGKYTFDYKNMTLIYNDNYQHLTRKEADLLKYFCNNINRVITRESALIAVWGDDDYFIGRSMDVFITKLRKYLKDDPNIQITNIHGTGFKFVVTE